MPVNNRTIAKNVKQVYVNRVAGALRLGTISSFDPETLALQVYIGSLQDYGSMANDPTNMVSTQLPIGYFNGSGGFAGGYPQPGTSVLLAQGDGGQWFTVTTLAKDVATQSSLSLTAPILEEDEYRIQADENTYIRMTGTHGINIGENNNSINLDTNRDTFSNTFDNIYTFSESSRVVSGTIMRDTFPNQLYGNTLRETNIEYNDVLRGIGFDPVARTATANNKASNRNPARVEHREIVYEYGRSFDVLSDAQEFLSYKDNKNNNLPNLTYRRDSRADVLSLSLTSPNFLMETIKGTVVDTFGNVLDINRSIIPLGKIEKLSIKNAKTNLEETAPLGNVFKNMKALERRSIAYHFEINSKKNLSAPPNVADRANYARDRSRFFLDIDKEGQFKLNVPASSETGNIPLLARYENYSTVHPSDPKNDPNGAVAVLNQDNQDILVEGLNGNKNNVIQIKDELNGNASPIDRFSNPGAPVHIKYGMMYHDITNTLSAFSDPLFFRERTFKLTTLLGRGLVPAKKNYFPSTIITSGNGANGGGRSGSMNFDGSLDLNIGANTISRHSLNADLQGALIMNVGRDCTANNIGAALHVDGEVLIQSGGDTPNDDKRFINRKLPDGTVLNNGKKPGVIDLRIINSAGGVNIVRISEEGIEIHSESRISIYSNGDMVFNTTGTMRLDSPNMFIQNRRVLKDGQAGSI